MAPSYLHIIHPPERRLPGITAWIGQVEALLRDDAKWDGCSFRRFEYDNQGAFDAPTVADLVRRSPGPVILVQKVQARVRERLLSILARTVSIYYVPVGTPEDLWSACEEAHAAFEDGEPRIYLRELVAYLILRKLDHLGRRGGAHQKGFLWADDLPRGGFPKDIVDARDVHDVAEQLVRTGVLERKSSKGQKKYALGATHLVQPVLDTRSFGHVPSLQKFFSRSRRLVTARLLDYGGG